MSSPTTLLSPFRWIGRAIGRLLKLLFGSWTPPPWLRGLARGVTWPCRRYPKATFLTLIIGGGGGYLGWKMWEESRSWQEAHRIRPREMVPARQVKATASAPEKPALDSKTGQLIPQRLTIRFSDVAAPLGQLHKPLAENRVPRLKPALAGQWTWTSQSELTFVPGKAWTPGAEYEVDLRTELAPNTELTIRSLKFTAAPLKIEAFNLVFETDARDGRTHEVVGTLRFSHGVAADRLQNALSIEALNRSPLFASAADMSGAALKMLPAKDDPRCVYFRTGKITVPDQEDFLKVTLADSLVSVDGGKPLGEAASEKVRIPNKDSRFFLKDSSALVLKDAEGEPHHTLFVKTEGWVEADVLTKSLQVVLLPADKPAQAGVPVSKNHAWMPGEIDDAVLKNATPVTVKHVPTATALTTEHAFDFKVDRPGCLFLRVPKGMAATGGFRLGANFATVVKVPPFEKEVQILGQGGVLALNGERKLSIKTRGASHVRYTLARVPAGQINHLVSLAEGNFESPYFYGGFNETNIAHFHDEVHVIPKKNDFEASYSVFDFTPALQREDRDDPEPSRGMFLLRANAGHPRVKAKAKEDGKVKPEGADGDAEEGEDEPAENPESEEDPNDGGDPDWINEFATAKRFILITDLGLLSKQSADGSRDVFVQSLEKGEPLADVALQIIAKNGQPVAEAKTDTEGHARLPDVSALKREKFPVAIVARKGSDLAFLPLARGDRAVDFSRFETGGIQHSQNDALDGFLFTERGIFRPGDTIHVGGLVRRRDWGGELEGVPVTLRMRNAKDAEAFTTDVELPADGFFSCDIPTGEADPTGVYQLDLYITNKAEEPVRIANTAIRVEDFQPDRMKLQAAFSRPAAAGWLAPADVSATVELQTLFGIAAENRRVTARLNLSPSDFSFDAYDEFIFHLPSPPDRKLPEAAVELGEVKTDANGKAAFPLALENYEGSFLATVSLEAFEADGGRGVRKTLSTLVSPRPWVVGWKADGDLSYVSKDAVREVKLVAVDPEVKPIAVPGLMERLVAIEHVSVLTKQENGSYAYTSTLNEKTVKEAPFEIAAAGATRALPTELTGSFRYELRTAEGDVVCAIAYTVVGKGDASRSLERNAELELQVKDQPWQAGQPLEFGVRAPYTGAGLITVEREKVLAWKWFKAGTSASVQSISLPADLEGSAYVNLSFVRALDSPEVFMSPVSNGVAPFYVEPAKRKLKVTLDTPKLVKPGEPVKIGYQTDQPGRIVIFAVDEGILQITDYELPQPLRTFFRQRQLEVTSLQTLDLLLPEFSVLSRQRAFGGDGDVALKRGLNPFKRRRDAPVVFWSGLLESGPDRREAVYQAPEYFAGTLRIMAVAVTAASIGQTESKTLVRGPFVLSPNVPVFSAPGDEFTASLTVANNLPANGAPHSLEVIARGTDHLTLVESPASPIKLESGKETTLRWKVRVNDKLGGAEMVFSVSGQGEGLSQRATLSVRPAAPFMTHLRTGYFRKASEDMTLGRQLYPDFAKRRASVSTLPLGLAAGLEEYLRNYPHGCSEQITSQAMARLLLSSEAEFGLDRAEATRQLTHTFQVLRSRQNAGGGFGYWDSRDASQGFDFLTVYIGHFLLEAQEAGFPIPAALLDGCAQRLLAMCRLKVTNLREAYLQSAAIYLLTRKGEVTTSFVLNLRDTLDSAFKNQPWVGDLTGAYLAAVYTLLQKKPEGLALMNQHRAAERKAYANYYDESPLASQSQSLMLVCRHFPELASAVGYKELEPILRPLNRGEFSTVSAAWSILALKSYSNLAAKTGVMAGLSELRGNVPVVLTPSKLGIVNGDFSAAATGVRFVLERANNAPDIGGFYQVTEAGYDRTLPDKSIADGIEITRSVRRLASGKTAVAESLRVGEPALMQISVRNLSGKTLTHLAVLDLLPGGFEIDPQSLRPGLNAAPGADYVDLREDRAVFYLSLANGRMQQFNYRAKGTAAGTYTTPPAFGESMYDRAVKARGVASKITITPAE